jgi:hypothetical protein
MLKHVYKMSYWSGHKQEALAVTVENRMRLQQDWVYQRVV